MACSSAYNSGNTSSFSRCLRTSLLGCHQHDGNRRNELRSLQSTHALRLEGTIWVYGFWTGLNYVAAASGQTETKVDTAAVVVQVKKTCAQSPSQVLANAVWTAYLDVNKR